MKSVFLLFINIMTSGNNIHLKGSCPCTRILGWVGGKKILPHLTNLFWGHTWPFGCSSRNRSWWWCPRRASRGRLCPGTPGARRSPGGSGSCIAGAATQLIPPTNIRRTTWKVPCAVEPCRIMKLVGGWGEGGGGSRLERMGKGLYSSGVSLGFSKK
jgi:hypothetical protein